MAPSVRSLAWRSSPRPAVSAAPSRAPTCADSAAPVTGRAPRRLRRRRGVQPVDSGGDALRLVLLHPRPHVLRLRRRVRRRRPGPRHARRVDRAQRRLHGVDDHDPRGHHVHRRHAGRRRRRDLQPAGHRHRASSSRRRSRTSPRSPIPTTPSGRSSRSSSSTTCRSSIYTGDDGDPERPVPWRNFPHTLTGQWGLIASPFWLAEVVENPELATQPIGSGPVRRRQLRAARLARGQPQPRLLDDRRRRQPAALPRLDHVPGHRGLRDRRRGAVSPATSTSSRSSNGRAIARGPGARRRVHRDRPGRVHRDRLPADRPRQARAVAGPPGALRDVAGDRPRGVQRRRPTDGFNDAANGLFSPGQQGYPRGQRAGRRAGPRDRRRR